MVVVIALASHLHGPVIALASHLRGPGSGHEWVKLVVGSLVFSERFFSGFSRFHPSSKVNISKFLNLNF